MEAWLAKHYLESQYRIPENLLQAFLNIWVEFGQRCSIFFENRASPGSTHEVPERITVMSQRLMELHYDMPLELFEACLGTTKKYSMALWERGAEDLDEAQFAMMSDLCDKAEISDGARILDLGCGFGSLMAYILERYPHCEICGLNLSRIHCQYIRDKQAEQGHVFQTKRLQLVEGDFSEFSTSKRFDRVLSIGFFEHVANLDAALRKISGFLEPSGQCFLHYIVSRKKRRIAKGRSEDFIQKYIFPGSHIYAFDELFNHQNDLQITQSWYLNGSNYQRTIESWLANFLENRDELQKIASLNEQTLKIWELYFRSCIAIFRLNKGRHYGNGQYRLLPKRS